MAHRGRDPLTTLARLPRRKEAGLHALRSCPFSRQKISKKVPFRRR